METARARVFCPHCDCMLHKKTFNTHKRLYYDEACDIWMKKRSEGLHDESMMDTMDTVEFSVDDNMPDEIPLLPSIPLDAPPLDNFDTDDEDNNMMNGEEIVLSLLM